MYVVGIGCFVIVGGGYVVCWLLCVVVVWLLLD